jgi:hypothetical protein
VSSQVAVGTVIISGIGEGSLNWSLTHCTQLTSLMILAS